MALFAFIRVHSRFRIDFIRVHSRSFAVLNDFQFDAQSLQKRGNLTLTLFAFIRVHSRF